MQKPHREPETWLTKAWDSPAICVAVLDESRTVREVNETFQSWSGETIVGSSLTSLVSVGQREVVNDLLDRAAFSGNDHVDVGMFPSADGVPIDVRLSIVTRAPITVVIEPYGAASASGMTEVLKLNERLSEMQRELRTKNLALEGALEEVQKSTLYIRKLEGILPICMTCKSVRDDEDEWMRLDKYLMQQKVVSLSHGLCPDCSEAMQADLEITP